MSLKLAFIDVVAFSYHPGTPEEEPLGGSQSAAIYLMRELAKRGHQIALANSAPEARHGHGILHFASNYHEAMFWADVVIFINGFQPDNLMEVRQKMPDKKFLLWMHHATNQDAARMLASFEIANAYDGMVFVSQWQLTEYQKAFQSLANKKLYVMRNAMAPAFENLFQPGEAIMPQKTWPPVLFYASTPFRGLDRLIAVYNRIAPQFPGLQLQVFSSMQVYKEAQDPYQEMYFWVSEQPGGQYIGSVTQPILAQYLKQAMCLVYPNTFEETSCIAVMEAMAAGSMIMTSDLGALPETCAGLARLETVMMPPEKHISEFALGCLEWLEQIYALQKNGELENELRKRVDYANAHYRWPIRAAEWETMLQDFVS